jgi:valyl-tRNA synthetase
VSRQLWWGHRIPVWYVHSSQADADSAEEGRSDRCAQTLLYNSHAWCAPLLYQLLLLPTVLQPTPCCSFLEMMPWQMMPWHALWQVL